MSSAIATPEAVQAAIAELEANNEKVTTEAIRKKLNGGSQGTIVRLLAQIRGGKVAVAEGDRIAEQSRKIMSDALAAVCRIERGAACDDFQEERHTHYDTIAKMVRDAQDAGAMLEAKDAVLHDALNRARDLEERNLVITAERDDLAAQLTRARDEIAMLNALLAEAESTRKSDPMLAEIHSFVRQLKGRSDVEDD